MISHNGFTWTTPEETHDAFEKIGGGIEPSCASDRRAADGKAVPCGKTTRYIVLTRDELFGKFSFVAMSKVAYKLEDLYYHPEQLCLECEAARYGFLDGRFHQDGYQAAIKGISKGPVTPEEAAIWRRIYSASFDKGREKANVEHLENMGKKDKSRYQPTKAAAR